MIQRPPGPVIQPVKKPYEQIADQLLTLIVDGTLKVGQQLPSEAELALDFGSSRATVREALRVLASYDLIKTKKGANGGSFVSEPSPDRIATHLSANLRLLSQVQHITLDDLLEARMLVEVPAARLAARKQDRSQFQRLRDLVPSAPLELTGDTQFRLNRDFHFGLVQASGNTLLSLAAEPIFLILQTHLRRSNLGDDFYVQMAEDHRAILKATENGEEDVVEEAMGAHIEYLRPRYEEAWAEIEDAHAPEDSAAVGRGLDKPDGHW